MKKPHPLPKGKWVNHVIQLPVPRIIPLKEPESFELFANPLPVAFGRSAEGKPVTLDGVVVGKVKVVIQDEMQIEIFKEHAELVNARLKGKPWDTK